MYVIPVGFIFIGSDVVITRIIIVYDVFKLSVIIKHDNVQSCQHLVHSNFIGIQHLKEMDERVFLDVFQYLFDKMFGVFITGY